MWEKIHRFFNPLCITCKINTQFNNFTNECENCFSISTRKINQEIDALERQKRVSELTEALQRAFPNGHPYR